MTKQTQYRLELISCTASWITFGALSILLSAKWIRGWTDDDRVLVVICTAFAVNALTQSRDLLKQLQRGATRHDGAPQNASPTVGRVAVPFTVLTHSVGCLAFGSMSKVLLNEWQSGWTGDDGVLAGLVIFLALGAFSDTRRLWKYESSAP